jgi:hypothetical protein
MRPRRQSLCSIGSALAAGASLAAAPPRVVDAVPNHADVAVNPALTQIRITFDQDMMTDRWSVCGGGPTFPDVVDTPRWEDPRIFILPVTLEPGRRYELSVNCPSARNFQSIAGESAEAYPITFITAQPGESAPALAEGRARDLAKALRQAIDERYSHRDVRGIDWDARFDELRPQLEGAATPAAFARAAAELLRANQDLHVSVEVNNVRLATGRRAVTPNADVQRLARVVPQWREFPGGARGRFEDGIGYLAINAWEGGDEVLDELLDTIGDLQDAPALVLDVRLNSGGDELMARRVAGCFREERFAYSRNLIRDPESPGGWAGPFDRFVEPATEGPRFHKRVAVLIGPACMSTCESFILMMHQPGQRETFGARTWGSSGNPRPHILGEGVTVYLSSWRDMTIDGGEIEGAGLKPDHDVEWRRGTRDPVLEAALQWLRSR